MSDYSEYIVTHEPPRPDPTIWHRIESYFRPVQFATEGKGLTELGKVTTKRLWVLSRGVLRRASRMDHVEKTEPFRRSP